MQPLVSVVIPVYNHESYVIKALQSVLEQTYPHVEMIVIDDGSKDRSVALVEQFLYQLSPSERQKIQWIVQKNQGAHHTINKGLKLARGDYLTILNSDDYYHPERLEKMVNALKNKKKLAFSRVFAIDHQGKPFDRNDPWQRWYEKSLAAINDYPGLGFSFFKANLAISSGNLFFSRSLYEQAGEFKDLKLAHDLDFLLRSVIYDEPVYIEEDLYYYRFHGTNTTHFVKHLLQEEMQHIHFNYLAKVTANKPPNPWAPCKWYWPYEFALLREELQLNNFFLKYLAQEDKGRTPHSSWHLKPGRAGKIFSFFSTYCALGVRLPSQISFYGIHEWPTWLVCASLPFKKVHWHIYDEIHPNAVLPGGLGRWIWEKVRRKKSLSFTFETPRIQSLWKTMGIEGHVLPRFQKEFDQAFHFGYRLKKGQMKEAEEVIDAFNDFKKRGMISGDAILQLAGFSDRIDTCQADLIIKVLNSSFDQHIYFRKDLDCSKIDVLIKNAKEFKKHE